MGMTYVMATQAGALLALRDAFTEEVKSLYRTQMSSGASPENFRAGLVRACAVYDTTARIIEGVLGQPHKEPP
jgi:hypothetical protein